MSAKQRKWYVVWEGYRPGVYDNWRDCQLQVVGFQGAKFKSYPTSEQAQEAFELGYQEGRQLGQQHRVAKPESNRLQVQHSVEPVSYTHLTLPTKLEWCRSRWSPYH